MAERIKVERLSELQARQVEAGASRDLRIEEGRMRAAVRNVIIMRCHDVNRVDELGRAYMTADEYEVEEGMMQFLRLIGPQVNPDFKTDHGNAGNVSPPMQKIIDDMADLSQGKPRRIPAPPDDTEQAPPIRDQEADLNRAAVAG